MHVLQVKVLILYCCILKLKCFFNTSMQVQGKCTQKVLKDSMQKNGSVTLIITYYIIKLLLMHNLKNIYFSLHFNAYKKLFKTIKTITKKAVNSHV